ncbi:hypothetical protein, variant [Phialophora macrospora]|uniref:Uncharacterized protein n=1 Tax=Phialophora macrospora TaxID=1851006 RepID=A0A0D2GAY9_9EURO|nr:hypothetical protein, variant [Phialophora macrospora]
MKRRRAGIHDFAVGWICALPIELTAAREALDEEYERIDDLAQYTLGRIGKHSVAIACLPAGQLGTSSAAAVAAHMQSTFPALVYGFMVGIAGGVPSKSVDIRLGDVVISHPQGRYGGVVQYDFGKTGPGGRQLPNGSLNSPNPILLQAVANMRSSISAGRSNIPLYMASVTLRNLFTRPVPNTEKLYDAAYDHAGGDTCDGCLAGKILQRPPRANQDIAIHYGTVASGNQVIKDGLSRDRISAEHGGVLCYEMEAAGLMNIFPCLVVRGICDYADSHKNKGWQPYAAAAAAACAKAVLSFVPTLPWRLNDEPQAQHNRGATNALPKSADHSKSAEFGTSTRCHQPDANGRFDPSSLYTKPSLTLMEKQSYHKSLEFGEINARHATIQDAHVETCRWLLDRPEYKDWLSLEKVSEHHGFLWIKGNPGTGKSTIMKFALAATKRTMPEAIFINFFFNARGDELEKTVLGMYRSLLFRLLDELQDLQDVFALLPPKLSESKTSYVWEVGALQSLFGHAVQGLGRRSLVCFIDALDECEEDEIRTMITFFEHLGDLGATSELRLRICLSSRHYPQITISHGISLVLEDQEEHYDDITKYVNGKLKGGRSKILDQMKGEICERSSGIFLWVVLVVQILKKEFDKGQINAVKKRLNEIPDGLDQLFDNIITRDTHDVDRLIWCLQWVLFARRPLEPIELFYAVMTGSEPDSIGDLDPRDIDEEILRNFVLDSSKGLATPTKGGNGTVQFIHESVRDYLLKSNHLQRLQADLASNFPGSIHEGLKKCCEGYINHVSSDNVEELLAKAGPSLKKSRLFHETHPFLNYAVRNVLFHADAAAEYGVNQERFVKEFPYRKWVTLSDSVRKSISYTCGPRASLLYIFASECVSNLISIEIRRVPCIDIKGEIYNYSLNAAIGRRSRKAVEALLAVENTSRSRGSARDGPSHITPGEWETAITDCLRTPLYVGNTVLHHAASNGNALLVNVLLKTKKVDVGFSNEDGTALSKAAQNGHAHVVKLLLETGQVDIESRDNNGRTAISEAASKGDAEVLGLLWTAWQTDVRSKGKPLDTTRLGLNRRDVNGMTPLHGAVSAQAVEVVKFLLSTDHIDLEVTNDRNETPLDLAARRLCNTAAHDPGRKKLEKIERLLRKALHNRARVPGEGSE